MKQAFPVAWRSSQRDLRRGVATVWTLVVLSVLTVVIAAVTRQLLTSRRWLDRRQDQIQAIWLARTGLELAATRLLSHPGGYAGESLQLVPESEIRIEVQKEPDPASTYSVTSEACYPTSSPTMVVHSLTRRFRRVAEKDMVRVEVVATPAPVKGDGRDQREEKKESGVNSAVSVARLGKRPAK